MTLRSFCYSYSSNWSQGPSVKSIKIPAALSLEIHNPTVVHLSYWPLHFCHHPFSAFYSAIPQPYSAELSTLRRTYMPILTYRIDIREDAKTHKVI